MIDYIVEIDTQIFLFLNSLHHPLLDTFMYCFSSKWVWVPLYLATFLMIMHYYGWKAGLILFGCTVAAVAISDQVCATFIRPVIERLRPANLENPISDMVHIVNNYRGGSYGFPSCHAANTFAFATIITLALPTRRLMFFLFGWALVNCYSRIYLGVHYPGDLTVGALIGSAAGLLCYAAFRTSVKLLLSNRRRTERITLSFMLPRPFDRAAFHIADVMIATGLIITAGIALYSLVS